MYRVDISGTFFLGTRRDAGQRYCARVMSLRPEALKGAGAGAAVAGQVDYRLARNSIVSEFQKGRLSRLDICDAHPDLLRAATNVGQELQEDCPICETAKLRLVSYVFGRGLAPSGVCVTSKKELDKVARTAKDLVCYVVEVCPECSWNHLNRSFAVTARR